MFTALRCRRKSLVQNAGGKNHTEKTRALLGGPGDCPRHHLDGAFVADRLPRDDDVVIPSKPESFKRK